MKTLKEKLCEIARDSSGCTIQHNNMPCNTCFHTWACEELGNDIGHLFWLVILSSRGDYTEKELMDGLKKTL